MGCDIKKSEDAVRETCRCVGEVIGDFLFDVVSDLLAETITVNKEKFIQRCRAYSEGLSDLKSEK